LEKQDATVVPFGKSAALETAKRKSPKEQAGAVSCLYADGGCWFEDFGRDNEDFTLMLYKQQG